MLKEISSTIVDYTKGTYDYAKKKPKEAAFKFAVGCVLGAITYNLGRRQENVEWKNALKDAVVIGVEREA